MSGLLRTSFGSCTPEVQIYKDLADDEAEYLVLLEGVKDGDDDGNGDHLEDNGDNVSIDNDNDNVSNLNELVLSDLPILVFVHLLECCAAI